MVDNRPATQQDLKNEVTSLKKEIRNLFDLREQWDAKRWDEHEKLERSMQQPVIDAIAKMDTILSSTDDTNLGLSFRVRKLEAVASQHRKGLFGVGGGTLAALANAAWDRLFG